MKYLLVLFIVLSTSSIADTLRFATFNVSMEASNYLAEGQTATGDELFQRLQIGNEQQIRNIAEIIQRVRPDVILLNEFDYTPDDEKGIKAFIHNYLHVPQGGQEVIDYPYYYSAGVNTGIDSGVDLDNDGIASGSGDDAFGYGQYPGQYGMVVLSRFPISVGKIRTFQHFLWKDMPSNLLPTITNVDGTPWYSPEAINVLRLSSKSHWDVPISVKGKTVHLLASHPTPPVFDGPENRNGKRNHDEIKFWVDYLSLGKDGYHRDDNGTVAGFTGERFVLVGDLNASVNEGDSHQQAIKSLLQHPLMLSGVKPVSEGGEQHSADNQYGRWHTAEWGMRADYVLPSKLGLSLVGQGVFWPTKEQTTYRLVKDRTSSSDHRLVWVDVKLD